MHNEYENRDYEELTNFAISFASSRIMPPAILGGFTLTAIIFLISISQTIVGYHWTDMLALVFYICFMLYIVTSILFDIYAGQAQKLTLKDIEISEKKRIIIRIMDKIDIVNKILLLTEVIMIVSMIFSGLIMTLGG
ncbi:MAG: hypothetical protein ACW98X_02220 [Promethearchaeota archaeon]|jgi:hypothetical protein